MHKYRLVAKKGEGTFSEVLKAQCIKNGRYCAIKCMKNHFDSLEQVNSLREIQALRRLSPHPNIIKLLEVLYDQPTGRLALVFELMDMNIYELIRGRRHYVAEDRVRRYMYQLLKAMDHMHRNGIFHRDIKPENILIMDDQLKLADFGSCRGIHSRQPYTEYISTRWYRAPECLLTDGYYSYKMDMWGVGCVFFEIVSLFPLFPGQNELDQINRIHRIMGTPSQDLLARMRKLSTHMDVHFAPEEGSGIERLIPHASPECVDLMHRLLAYNPDDRISARQALRHPYFRELREAEKRTRSLLTPELSHGTLGMPPATGDSARSGGAGLLNSTRRSDATGGRLSKEGSLGALPSITGKGTSRTSDHALPNAGGGGGKPWHQESDEDTHPIGGGGGAGGGGGGGGSNLPPISGSGALGGSHVSKARHGGKHATHGAHGGGFGYQRSGAYGKQRHAKPSGSKVKGVASSEDPDDTPSALRGSHRGVARGGHSTKKYGGAHGSIKYGTGGLGKHAAQHSSSNLHN
ncbi:unnamed protein product [Pedinophyceae sp. YPF-701]|nr:unnamed protein product [Pedinophyceae sp. YPF-701]